jgi:hypothetical protein
MIRRILAIYWSCRLYKNHMKANDLLQLKRDCAGYECLEEEVQLQIDLMNSLITQAEKELLKYQRVTTQ